MENTTDIAITEEIKSGELWVGNFTDTEKVKLSELWVGDKVIGSLWVGKDQYGNVRHAINMADKSQLQKKKSDKVWRIFTVSKIVKGKKTKENAARNREGAMITIYFKETEATIHLKHWNTCLTA